MKTTKMSSRGQIVIPSDIRKVTSTEEGSIFAIYSEKDIIILKKISTPSISEIKQKLKNIK
jgi:AbrB family looped-hinge helix DNA binding protein